MSFSKLYYLNIEDNASQLNHTHKCLKRWSFTKREHNSEWVNDAGLIKTGFSKNRVIKYISVWTHGGVFHYIHLLKTFYIVYQETDQHVCHEHVVAVWNCHRETEEKLSEFYRHWRFFVILQITSISPSPFTEIKVINTFWKYCAFLSNE